MWGWVTFVWGSPATTLSGGEAQRVKLASELQRRQTGKTFYILDEPTTGLHFDDVRQLLECCSVWWTRGNTVLVIEHNLDIIKAADYVVDLGPEGAIAVALSWRPARPRKLLRCPKATRVASWLASSLRANAPKAVVTSVAGLGCR